MWPTLPLPKEVGVNQSRVVCTERPLGPEGPQDPGQEAQSPPTGACISTGRQWLHGKLPLQVGGFRSPLLPQKNTPIHLLSKDWSHPKRCIAQIQTLVLVVD